MGNDYIDRPSPVGCVQLALSLYACFFINEKVEDWGWLASYNIPYR